MGLRPGRTIRRIERPWTRVSQRKPRKSYVVGVPFAKLHQFEMGTKGNYDTIVHVVAERSVQIRDNAIEAGRIVAQNFLEKKVGLTNYFMKILVYPHQVLREKPIATGAGADRYSQGMAHPFGKPVGRAARLKKDQRIITVRTNKAFIPTVKQAMRKFGLKISTPIRLEFE